MSQQPKTNQAKYANLNLNAALASRGGGQGQASGSGLAQGSSTLTRGGFLLLSKRPRATGLKLSVPKPVNLPSIKKEHGGNDPSTHLVPASTGSGTWTKPEEPSAAQEVSAKASITSTSTWASQSAKPASSGPWLPSERPSVPGPARAADRLLNPEEYPSLAASARVDAAGAGRQQGKADQPDSRAWADDERAPSGGGGWRASADWSSRMDDDRYVGDRMEHRAPWDDRGRGYEYEGGGHGTRPTYDDDAREGGRRYGGGYGFEQGGYGASGGFQRGYDPPPPPPRRYGGGDGPPYGRGYDLYDDRSLFPPPPPPRTQQPAEVEEEDDPERRAFEAELNRVAADLERRKQEESRDSLAEKRSMQESEDVPSQPDSLGVSSVSDSETVAHARPAKPAPSRFMARELVEDEEERSRRERASQKLRELEQQMAARAGAAAAAPAAVEAAAASAADADAPKAQAGPWKKLPKEEDLAWDDDSQTAQSKAADETESEKSMPRPGSAMSGGSQGAAASKASPQPAQPPPPPPRSPAAQQQPEPVLVSAWQQQRPPLPQQQQPQQPQQASTHHHNHNQARMMPPGGAMFGSFDDDLFEELSKVPLQPIQPPQPQQQQPQRKEQAPAQPKPWRPVEGTVPVVLAHAPAPSATMAQQQQQRPAPLAPSQQQVHKDTVQSTMQEPGDDSGSREMSGRGRGGRSRGARSGGGRSGFDTEEVYSSDDTSSGRGGRGGRGSYALRGGRGGRGNGGGRGEKTNNDSAVYGSAAPRGQSRGSESARGGRGLRVARSSTFPEEDVEGDSRAGKVPRLGRHDLPVVLGGAAASAADNSKQAPAAAAAAVTAPGVSSSQSLTPTAIQPPAAVPMAWGSEGIAKATAGLSLNDPVLNPPVRSVSLSAVAVSPPTDAAKQVGLGFDRQVGPPKQVNAQRQGLGPSATSPSADRPALGSPSVVAKGDTLDNGILALPADLTLDMVPTPEPRGLGQGFGAVSTGSGNSGGLSNRPIGGPFAFGNGTVPGSTPGSSSATATPPGIAAMWEQPGSAGSAARTQSSAPTTPAMTWASMFPASGSPQIGAAGSGNGSAANGQNAQLMFGTHFGAFNAPPPPRSFVGQAAAPFGGLGSSTWQTQPGQQPFLPSNKPPDWSIGPVSAPIGPLGSLGMTSPSFSVAPGDGKSAGSSGTPNGMMSSFGNALGAPGMPLQNLAPGSFSSSQTSQQQPRPGLQQQQQQQVAGKPGVPFGTAAQQHPQRQQQQQQQLLTNRQQQQQQRPVSSAPTSTAAAVANLPDDIFDSKPVGPAVAPGPPRGPPPAQPGPIGAPGPRMAGPGPHMAGARDVVMDKHQSGRGAGGRGNRGGRGGRGGEPDIRQGMEGPSGGVRGDAGGRGFAGRNGRGSGRSGAPPPPSHHMPGPAFSLVPPPVQLAPPAVGLGNTGVGQSEGPAVPADGGRGGGKGGRARGGGGGRAGPPPARGGNGRGPPPGRAAPPPPKP